MKLLALAALSIFGLVAAQDLTGLPTCAYNCALTGIGSTGCQATNATCICSAQSFLSDVQTCIAAPGGCNEADQQATIEFANKFCGGSVGGSNSTSSPSSGTAAATGSSASASGSGSASTTESSSGSAATSGSESASAASSSASGPASEVSSGSFAGPTLAALGVAQLLGVAGVVVAAL